MAILEEYRVKCENEGNYLEASRAYKQLGILRQQEEKRQQKVIQARHISERQDVMAAHQMQYQEFSRSWDKYLEEYDQMAQMYIQQMTERHALVLLEYQKKLREELANKPPKWSKNLMDQRRKQHINARNKNYLMAQKLKKISDLEEMKEREEMEQNQTMIFIRKETKFRQQQQNELQALLKRIEYRRKEHIAQRELDTKRLLQRNKNVQSVLENKQNQEEIKLFNEIKKNLYSTSILYVANGGGANTNSSTGTLRKSKSGPNSSSTFSPNLSSQLDGSGSGNGNGQNQKARKQSKAGLGRVGGSENGNLSGRMPNAQESNGSGYNAMNSSIGSSFNLPNLKNDQEMMMANNNNYSGSGEDQGGNNEQDFVPGNFASLVYNQNDIEDESLESYA